jgi:hypothetical protein
MQAAGIFVKTGGLPGLFEDSAQVRDCGAFFSGSTMQAAGTIGITTANRTTMPDRYIKP